MSGHLLWCTSLLSLSIMLTNSYHQCPSDLQGICMCSADISKDISVKCNGGGSLEEVLNILNAIIHTSLDELVIINTPIREIPDFAFRNLTSKKLTLQGNGITTIHENAFAGPLMDRLEVLDISNNKLLTVEQPGISMLRNLHTLNLCNNTISSLPPNAFLSYRSRFILKSLDLSVNQLTQIPNYAFSGLESLEFLRIEKNALKMIPTDALKALQSLESLLLTVNEIKNIKANALPLPNLKITSLEDNLISEISVGAFGQNPHLSSLYLNDNQLSHIEPLIFKPILQLRILNIGSNKLLTTITKREMEYLETLIRLDLSDCSISTIEDGAFQQLQQLQIISLSGNRLKQIGQIFPGLQYLTTIDLSNNEINEVKNFAFSNLPSLNHLDLSRNQLTTLPESALQGTLKTTWPPITRDFYLYDNPWNCDHRLQWLKKWLSDNENVHITAPGHQPTRCQEPPSLRGADIRNAIFLKQQFRNTFPPTTIRPAPATPKQNRNLNFGNAVLPVRWTTKLPAFATTLSNLVPQTKPRNQKNEISLQKMVKYATGDPDKTTVPLKATEQRYLDEEVQEGTKAATIVLVIAFVLGGVTICGILLLVIWYRMKRSTSRENNFKHNVSTASTVTGACATYDFSIYKRDPWFNGHRQRPRSFLKKTWKKWF